MSSNDDDRIQLQPPKAYVRVALDAIAIADTQQAIELDERGYPPRFYIPRADVDTGVLRKSQTVTRCPFKGEATYYHLQIDGDILEDAAWSYEQPNDAVAAIAANLSFDHPRLSLQFDEN